MPFFLYSNHKISRVRAKTILTIKEIKEKKYRRYSSIYKKKTNYVENVP